MVLMKTRSILLILSLSVVANAFVLGPPRPAFSVSRMSPLSFRERHRTKLFFFGNMFGSDSTNDKDGELAKFSDLPIEQYDALTEYIRQWALLLESEGSLTTPVKVLTNTKGAQILFQPKKSTYKSKDEERAAEKGQGETKKEPPKHGGVQVVVEQTDSGVQVLASRCEMDEDTMIREMSEEAIVDGLKKAIKVWKKDHPV